MYCIVNCSQRVRLVTSYKTKGLTMLFKNESNGLAAEVKKEFRVVKTLINKNWFDITDFNVVQHEVHYYTNWNCCFSVDHTFKNEEEAIKSARNYCRLIDEIIPAE